MQLKGRMREGNMPLSCRHTRKLSVVRLLEPRTLNTGEVSRLDIREVAGEPRASPFVPSHGPYEHVAHDYPQEATIESSLPLCAAAVRHIRQGWNRTERSCILQCCLSTTVHMGPHSICRGAGCPVAMYLWAWTCRVTCCWRMSLPRCCFVVLAMGHGFIFREHWIHYAAERKEGWPSALGAEVIGYRPLV